uniref:Uncharacterized protein n=1 Tax=Anguilla anguilla TaxID=7936 RepID=A0A0E9TS22_ANGAN
MLYIRKWPKRHRKLFLKNT